MEALATPEEGWTLDGRYALERPVGEGGMAIVWRATHRSLQRPVAVKFLRRSDDAELRERFLREAQVAAAIRHRHVVDVIDFGVERGWVYMVMELLEGSTLRTVIEQDGALDLPVAVRLLAQILGGLTAVHDAGMIHRDVKPDNVVLVQDADGVYPKLLDFGVSKSAFAHQSGEHTLGSVIPTEENMIVGTPEYMAPEQIQAEQPLTAAVDVYAAGALMYEMLSGERPFGSGGSNSAALLIRAATQRPRPLATLRPDLPEPIVAFVDRAMARSPDERFPDARAMRRGLIVAVCKTVQALEASQPKLAQELGRALGAAYEPGDSAVIYVGAGVSGAYPAARHSTPTIDEMVPPTPRASRGRWPWVLAGLAVAGLLVGVWAGGRTEDASAAESAAVPEAAPREPAPPTVTVELRSLPEGATLRVDGRDASGPRVQLLRDDRPHTLEVTAPGRMPWRRTVTADADQNVEIELEGVASDEASQSSDEPPQRPAAAAPPRSLRAGRAREPAPMRPTTRAEQVARPTQQPRFRDPGF